MASTLGAKTEGQHEEEDVNGTGSDMRTSGDGKEVTMVGSCCPENINIYCTEPSAHMEADGEPQNKPATEEDLKKIEGGLTDTVEGQVIKSKTQQVFSGDPPSPSKQETDHTASGDLVSCDLDTSDGISTQNPTVSQALNSIAASCQHDEQEELKLRSQSSPHDIQEVEQVRHNTEDDSEELKDQRDTSKQDGHQETAVSDIVGGSKILEGTADARISAEDAAWFLADSEYRKRKLKIVTKVDVEIAKDGQVRFETDEIGKDMSWCVQCLMAMCASRTGDDADLQLRQPVSVVEVPGMDVKKAINGTNGARLLDVSDKHGVVAVFLQREEEEGAQTLEDKDGDFKVGMTVEGKYGSQWFDAEITELEGDTITIRWGFDGSEEALTQNKVRRQQVSRHEVERLAIFGDLRPRMEMELAMLSVVELRIPGHFESMQRSSYESDGIGLGIVNLEKGVLGKVIGRAGAIRKKISKACGTTSEYLGTVACFIGNKEERIRHSALLRLMAASVDNQIDAVPEALAGYSQNIEVPKEAIGVIIGSRREQLNQIEDETKTFTLFLARDKETTNNEGDLDIKEGLIVEAQFRGVWEEATVLEIMGEEDADDTSNERHIRTLKLCWLQNGNEALVPENHVRKPGADTLRPKHDDSPSTRTLVIFGKKRSRLAAVLRIMALVEAKCPGSKLQNITSNSQEADGEDMQMRVDQLSEEEEYRSRDSAFTAWMRRASVAAHCVIQLVGCALHYAGTHDEIARARDFMRPVIVGHPSQFDTTDMNFNDVDKILMTADQKNCISTSRIERIEGETSTLLFFDGSAALTGLEDSAWMIVLGCDSNNRALAMDKLNEALQAGPQSHSEHGGGHQAAHHDDDEHEDGEVIKRRRTRHGWQGQRKWDDTWDDNNKDDDANHRKTNQWQESGLRDDQDNWRRDSSWRNWDQRRGRETDWDKQGSRDSDRDQRGSSNKDWDHRKSRDTDWDSKGNRPRDWDHRGGRDKDWDHRRSRNDDWDRRGQDDDQKRSTRSKVWDQREGRDSQNSWSNREQWKSKGVWDEGQDWRSINKKDRNESQDGRGNWHDDKSMWRTEDRDLERGRQKGEPGRWQDTNDNWDQKRWEKQSNWQDAKSWDTQQWDTKQHWPDKRDSSRKRSWDRHSQGHENDNEGNSRRKDRPPLRWRDKDDSSAREQCNKRRRVEEGPRPPSHEPGQRREGKGEHTRRESFRSKHVETPFEPDRRYYRNSPSPGPPSEPAAGAYVFDDGIDSNSDNKDNIQEAGAYVMDALQESTSDNREEKGSRIRSKRGKDPEAMLSRIGFPETVEEWEAVQDTVWEHHPPLPRGWLRVWSKNSRETYFLRKEDSFTTFDEPRR